MHKLYSEVLSKSTLFTSKEEISFYRKMWLRHDFLMPGILNKLASQVDSKRIIGLYPGTQHAGFCILSSSSCLLMRIRKT